MITVPFASIRVVNTASVWRYLGYRDEMQRCVRPGWQIADHRRADYYAGVRAARMRRDTGRVLARRRPTGLRILADDHHSL